MVKLKARFVTRKCYNNGIHCHGLTIRTLYLKGIAIKSLKTSATIRFFPPESVSFLFICVYMGTYIASLLARMQRCTSSKILIRLQTGGCSSFTA